MRIKYLINYFLILLLIACSHQSTSDTLKPFTSDGCSLFPDRSLISSNDWCSCCFEHDIAYWLGGTSEQRDIADLALRDCVLEKTDDMMLANTMHKGVQIGGSPSFNTWYRWGYGWNYQRKYKELTSTETSLARTKLESYYKSKAPLVCKSNIDTGE